MVCMTNTDRTAADLSADVGFGCGRTLISNSNRSGIVIDADLACVRVKTSRLIWYCGSLL